MKRLITGYRVQFEGGMVIRRFGTPSEALRSAEGYSKKKKGTQDILVIREFSGGEEEILKRLSHANKPT